MKTQNRSFTFKNTAHNGELAGTTHDYEVPEFDWEAFKNLPNAKLFARRAYDSTLRKLVREILSGNKNGTTDQHLQSMESVIARTFNFTKTRIEQWCKTRDWGEVEFKGDRQKAIELLTERLPDFAVTDTSIPDTQTREKCAMIIAAVSDRETDDIAEFLWVKLTQKPKENDDLLLIL